MRIKVRVVPNSTRAKIKGSDGQLRVWLKSSPERGMANRELINVFKKQGINVRILSGSTSRNKLLELDIDEETFKQRFCDQTEEKT